MISMIELLKSIEEIEFASTGIIKSLLAMPERWNTVDVNYHPPRVERLWTQLGENRLMLHIIHPCKPEEALYHPHPWPSAMHVLRGKYEMGLGFINREEPLLPVKQIAKLELNGDNYYEMLDPKGWHYVRPINEPCFTVMLTGKPWDSNEGKDLPNPGQLKELSEDRKMQILSSFELYYLK